MTTQIIWTISALNCVPETPQGADYVTVVHWECTGVNGEYTAQVYNTCSFPITQGDFTPYSNLTQDQVLGWCWANGVDKAATEAAVQHQIDNQINPPILSPKLPWITSPTAK